MVVSENSGTSKSSILIGFSIIKHPFWGSSIFGNTHMYTPKKKNITLEKVTMKEDVSHYFKWWLSFCHVSFQGVYIDGTICLRDILMAELVR